MTISGGSALDKDEIDRMVKDAEAHAAEDAKRREAAEARNQAEQVVYSTEKFIADNGDKLPEAEKSEVDTALSDLKAVVAQEDADPEDLKAKTTAVSEASQKMGAAMYAAQSEAGDAGAQGAPGAEGAGDEQAADEDVVDAEVVEDDDQGTTDQSK